MVCMSIPIFRDTSAAYFFHSLFLVPLRAGAAVHKRQGAPKWGAAKSAAKEHGPKFQAKLPRQASDFAKHGSRARGNAIVEPSDHDKKVDQRFQMGIAFTLYILWLAGAWTVLMTAEDIMDGVPISGASNVMQGAMPAIGLHVYRTSNLSTTPQDVDYWPGPGEYDAYMERRKARKTTAEDDAKGDQMVADFMALRARRRKEGREAAGYKMTCDGCGGSHREAELMSCPHCLFTACESCQVHTSRGICKCAKGNMGTPYCKMEPASYHAARAGKQYAGPRHPEKTPWNKDQYDWESTPRDCTNCGKKGVIHLDPRSAKGTGENTDFVILEKRNHPFSNGSHYWIQYLAKSTSSPDAYYNLAQLGATTSNAVVYSNGAGDFSTQVATFLQYFNSTSAEVKWDADATLFAIWFGNDDMYNMNTAGKSFVANQLPLLTALDVQIGLLYNAGARHMLIPGLPTLSLTPIATDFGSTLLLQGVTYWNTQLVTYIGLLSQKYPDLNAYYLDSTAVFTSIFASRAQYGIKNPLTACMSYSFTTNNPSFSDPACVYPLAAYAWRDYWHPTWTMHQVLAGAAALAESTPLVPTGTFSLSSLFRLLHDCPNNRRRPSRLLRTRRRERHFFSFGLAASSSDYE
ncbi:hypothetical protein RQP46_006265 [Phenoliferia psychrophenolica]